MKTQLNTLRGESEETTNLLDKELNFAVVFLETKMLGTSPSRCLCLTTPGSALVRRTVSSGAKRSPSMETEPFGR